MRPASSEKSGPVQPVFRSHDDNEELATSCRFSRSNNEGTQLP
jgi:hypothetical protein